MQLNPEITYGNLLTILGMAVAALGVFGKLVGELGTLKTSVNGALDTIKESFKGELALLRQLLASSSERIDRMERRHDERMAQTDRQIAIQQEEQKKMTMVLERVIGQHEAINWDGRNERRASERRG